MSKIPPDGDRAHNGYVSNGVHRPALAVASSKQAQEEVVRSKQVNANGAAAGPGILVTMDRSKCGEDGRPVVFRDPRTKLILRRLFSELCPACEKHLKQVERDLVRLADTDTESAKLVRRVSFLLVEFIRNTEQLSMNLKNFVEEEWNLHAGNMHMEFSKVAYETFREAANWGRVAMFLGFAVSFAVYLERGIVVGSADSVMEWTCQVVEENVGHFYTSHEGWEGFGDYLETALRVTKLKKNREASDEESKVSLWNGAFAAGAVAVGAMAALTLRQAFS